MHTLQISIRLGPAGLERLVSAVDDLVGALLQNWQLYGCPVVTSGRRGVTVYAYAPASDALDEKYDSVFVRKARRTVRKIAGTLPTVKPRGARAATAAVDWQREKCLCLFTNAFDIVSPIVAGKENCPVAPYLLPLHDRERVHLYFWAVHYRAVDRLFFESTGLECLAYRELSCPTSDLSKRGRSVAREVEKATGKPTFYFLAARGRGGPSKARPGRCPSCGKAWARVGDTDLSTTRFDVACERCRLVSLGPEKGAAGKGGRKW